MTAVVPGERTAGPDAPEIWARVALAVAALVAVVGVFTMLGGGRLLPWNVEHYTPAPAAVVDAVDCLAVTTGMAMVPTSTHVLPQPGSVPAGFAPISAVLCRATLELEDTPAGRWQLRVEDRLSGRLGPLLTALAEPSDRALIDVACTTELRLDPTIWLVDAQGRAMVAAEPTDACGKPKPGVGQALAAMTVVETIRHRVQPLAPEAPISPLPAPDETPAVPAPDFGPPRPPVPAPPPAAP